MRTAIFFGLIIIAKAICATIVRDIGTELSIIISVMMIMDIVEFINKIMKENGNT